MRHVVTLFLCVQPAFAQDNLLVNGGFEELNAEGRPRNWELFVMPMEGARGTVDDDAFSGQYCAMLRIPEPYSRDPANNWSQSIFGDHGGKELLIEGHLKTEDATDAAIWLQCFARNPTRVVAAATSSTNSPVYGTRDWTLVRLRLRVPEDTDFVVLRCVLKGRGTAWFDNLSVRRVLREDELAPLEPAANTTEKPATETQAPELLEAATAMQSAVRELKESNEQLRAQLDSLQRELSSIGQRVQPAPGPYGRHPIIPTDPTRGRRNTPPTPEQTPTVRIEPMTNPLP